MNAIRKRRVGLWSALGLGSLLAAFSCSGGAAGTSTGSSSASGARAALTGIDYGRLVDVYAWRRTNKNNADRLDPANRVPVLVEREVLVNPQIRDEDPFNNGAARYRYMPYDPSVGHRELLILWDDQAEKQQFDRALTNAQVGLPAVAPHFAFAPLPSPPPVVPDDAALRLTFDRPLGLDTAFFAATPGTVQVLRLTADPDKVDPSVAYTPVPVRIIVKNNGKQILIDPEITGNEAKNRSPNPEGLPPSLDAKSANIRIALPVEGTLTRRFRVRKDQVPTLNSVDVNGNAAVIRDFRSGNSTDANNGNLPDVNDPVLVARKGMGILSVDAQNRILMINKRFANVVIRGRLPFVDGPVSVVSGKPTGSQNVPQVRPFASGDMVWQDVRAPSGETVRVKAEVIRNFDIPVLENDKNLGVGGGNAVVRIQVSNVHAFDSQGNQVTFQDSDLPLGADCTCVIHYRHQVKVANGAKDVGDSGRVAEFLTFVPAPPRLDANRNPQPPNVDIDPVASVALAFSKPMAVSTVRAEDNFVIANRLGNKPRFIDDVKVGNLSVVPTLPTDLDLDGTRIRLTTPMGLFHTKGQTETYYIHLRDGKTGPLDRSGRAIELFDIDDIDAVTFDFKLAKNAASNLVGSILRRMNSPDEDGTSDKSTTIDYFGQFQQRDGRLFGWPSTRFSRVADNTTLSQIRRDLSGECRDTMGNKQPPCPGVPNPMFLYQTPLMIFQGLGGIAEPHITQGSRLQMTYREDDFSLAYTDVTQLEIDVEQLHWAPFVGRVPSLLTFDLFDRVSIVLGTAEKRPDMRPLVVQRGPNQCCAWDPATFQSGLTPSFSGNYVDNGKPVEVVTDKVYAINPNNAFATSTGSTMIAYPKFDDTYTWRDRRYLAWDFSNNVPTGLGGSQNPTDPNRPDRTKDISSPHVPEVKPDIDGINSKQPDDYLGNKVQDHGPFALPLLVDFFVFADDPKNGLAKGDNLFQIGYVGPPYPVPGHGYYNQGWPWLRVHSTGGIDNQQNEIIVDPRNATTARGGWVNNAILGRFNAPPGDDHIYWAQGDFVRKISVVTYGYVDTLVPGKNDVTGPPGWAADRNGYPNLAGVSTRLRPAEWALIMSPAPEKLPQGTKVLVEFRGSEGFDKSAEVYKFDENETAKSRGNLLNPNFACEQFRYQGSARVLSTGFTNYVKDPDDLIDGQTLVAPRFINWRFTFVNNTAVTPARVPFVDYFALIYRVKNPK